MRPLQLNVQLGQVTLPKGPQPMVVIEGVFCGPDLAGVTDARAAVKLVADWLLKHADTLVAETLSGPETGVIVIGGRKL